LTKQPKGENINPRIIKAGGETGGNWIVVTLQIKPRSSTSCRLSRGQFIPFQNSDGPAIVNLHNHCSPIMIVDCKGGQVINITFDPQDVW